MALSAKLQLKQSQSLVMTPQLLQSIKLLQLSNVELSEFVVDEVEKNPLLEIDQNEIGSSRREEGATPPSQQGSETGQQSGSQDLNDVIAASPGMDSASLENGLDGGSENLYDSDMPARNDQSQLGSLGSSSSGSSGSGGSTISAQDYNLEDFVASSQNLYEYLNAQAVLEFRSESTRQIALEIIGALDEDGYLREPTTAIAATLGVPNAHVLGVLKRVQGLEPAGVGARDIKECLALQLAEKNRLDPAMEAMISNLDLLAKREFGKLQKLCAVNDEDFHDMIQEIRALDPRPGSSFKGEPVEVVVPDVIVSEDQNGSWSVELNQETLPRVLVNRSYYAEITKDLEGGQAMEFMVDCMNNASWLVKSLDQRAQTILKVASEIVKKQDMFLAYGIEYLKPLNLKTVADEIGMHESTVSRVTSNKYMLTSRGLFELKYFFTTAIQSNDGSADHSAEVVKHHIKQLIDAELPEKILSDDAIVSQLTEKGIDIARRTVAKYREAMHIPSSVQRRREKKTHKFAHTG